MDDRRAVTKPGMSGITKAWLISLVAFLPLSFVLGWLDNATQLTPDHSSSQVSILIFAGLAALANAVVGFRLTAAGMLRGGTGAFNSILACAGFAVAGFITTILMLIPARDIAHGLLDFPPGRTKRVDTEIHISRAYEMHGKGRSWHIQTMPIWSDIDISKTDFAFMQANRSPDDKERKSDEVTSNGYFCARVTLEQAGAAVRVLHAGAGKLPDGSIVKCNSNEARPSRL
jgi:hypothetical protein